MKSLPNLLLLGAQKGGSSSLYDELTACDGISGGHEKEPGDLTRYDGSQSALERYSNKFDRAGGARYVIDGSTTYAMRQRHPNVPLTAHRLLGNDLKMVYIVRDPLARSLSHHVHLYRRGLAPRSFDEALASHGGLILNSLYSYQLEPWIDRFGRQNVFILDLESLSASRSDVFESLSQFLGISLNPRTEALMSNTAADPIVDRRGAAGRILRSRAYRDLLRPKIPVLIRESVRAAAAATEPPPVVPPSVAVQGILQMIFANEVEEFNSLIGLDIGSLSIRSTMSEK